MEQARAKLAPRKRQLGSKQSKAELIARPGVGTHPTLVKIGRMECCRPRLATKAAGERRRKNTKNNSIQTSFLALRGLAGMAIRLTKAVASPIKSSQLPNTSPRVSSLPQRPAIMERAEATCQISDAPPIAKKGANGPNKVGVVLLTKE